MLLRWKTSVKARCFFYFTYRIICKWYFIFLPQEKKLFCFNLSCGPICGLWANWRFRLHAEFIWLLNMLIKHVDINMESLFQHEPQINTKDNNGVTFVIINVSLLWDYRQCKLSHCTCLCLLWRYLFYYCLLPAITIPLTFCRCFLSLSVRQTFRWSNM